MEMAGTIFITGATGLIGVRILLAALAPCSPQAIRQFDRFDRFSPGVLSAGRGDKYTVSYQYQLLFVMSGLD